MINLNAIKTVYSYYLPEVRSIVDELTVDYPHNVYLRSTTGEGLDNFEQPVIQQFREFQKDALPGLSKFPYAYWTAGAEEGIREYMSLLAASSLPQDACAFLNEYEGYEAVAATRRIPFTTSDDGKVPTSYFFISNPSARDGNIIPDSKINGICDQGHKVFYDLSYLGSTQAHTFDLTHENVSAVAVSFSKPYGLFYHRIGLLFSKQPVPGLYGNKWFKNILSIMIANRVMSEIGSAMTIPQRYKPYQKQIVDGINRQYGLGLQCSDAWLLAHRPNSNGLDEEQLAALKPFARGDGYRLCLTKYYEDLEPRKILSDRL